jgi:hypothetical protein
LYQAIYNLADLVQIFSFEFVNSSKIESRLAWVGSWLGHVRLYLSLLTFPDQGTQRNKVTQRCCCDNIIFNMPSSSIIKSELLAQNPKSITQNKQTIINFHQHFVVSTLSWTD